MKPLGVQFSELQFTLRDNEWIAIKTGMLLVAVIHRYGPSSIEDFNEEVKTFYQQSLES